MWENTYQKKLRRPYELEDTFLKTSILPELHIEESRSLSSITEDKQKGFFKKIIFRMENSVNCSTALFGNICYFGVIIRVLIIRIL